MGVIASIYKGYGIGGCISYCLEEGKGLDGGVPVIIDRSFVEGDTVAELTRSFAPYRRIAGPGKDVWDVPFSWRRRELRDRATRIDYMNDWKRLMGLADCPSVAFEHHDADNNLNDHLVLLVMDGTGERVHQGWDRTRSNKICGELDAKYGLEPENRTRKTGDEIEIDGPEIGPGGKLKLAKLQLESAIDRAKARDGTWAALDEELRRGGYELVPIMHGKGKLAGQVKGIGVRDLVDERAYFNGSDLHRKLSYANIVKHHGLHGEMPGVVHEQPIPIAPDPREVGTGTELGATPSYARVAGDPVPVSQPVGRGDSRRSGTRQAVEAVPGHHGQAPGGTVGGGPGHSRHGGSGRRSGRLLPGDQGDLGGLDGARQPVAGGPRLVAPAVRAPQVTGNQPVGIPLPVAGGPGAAQSQPPHGRRLADENLQVGGGGGQGPQAGDPPVGDPVRRDPILGGGADVPHLATRAVPEPALLSGLSGTPGSRIAPGGDTAAQAAERAAGGGTPEPRLHPSGRTGPGLDAEVRSPGGSDLGGDEVEGFDPFEGLGPIHVVNELTILAKKSRQEDEAWRQAQQKSVQDRVVVKQAEAKPSSVEKGHKL